MKAKETRYFRIKVSKPFEMKRARKLIFVSSHTKGCSVYRTIAFEEKEEVQTYLTTLGLEPETVSKLSLQNMT